MAVILFRAHSITIQVQLQSAGWILTAMSGMEVYLDNEHVIVDSNQPIFYKRMKGEAWSSFIDSINRFLFGIVNLIPILDKTKASLFK